MDDFQTTQMQNSRIPRRTYLITYSQADLSKFPTRKDFGKCIKSHFNKGSGKVKVQHWACSLEKHQNGGDHFHVALKLTGPKRWKSVKESISSDEGIVVNFSDQHDNYYSAYRYVCKEDSSVHHSKHHPNLENISSPRTKRSTKAYRESRKSKNSAENETSEPPSKKPSTSSKQKPTRLSRLDVSEFMVKNDIHRVKELYAAAEQRRKEGQADLKSFVISNTRKSLNDLIENTWEMHSALESIEREKTSRIEVLQKAREKSCIDGCDMEWFTCAREVLRNNNVNAYVYADAVRELLKSGRGKFRNIMITGPASCGKTFLLKPLEKIYDTFRNPANDKYAWVGADKAEVILLQDFRWSRELISWNSLLLLLEGELVKLPSPKNQFAADVCIDTDVPLFATSKASVEFVGRNNQGDAGEDAMMNDRWRLFTFHRRIPQDEQKKIASCPRCFAELVFLGDSE